MKKQPENRLLFKKKLLLDDLQDLHGASLDTDAAGDALGSRILGLQDHDLGGTDFHTLAAGNTLLLVDHVHAGLGVLGDCLVFTNLGALATLDADHGLSAGTLGNDLDAGQIGVELLIECFGASLDAFQTSHTLGTLFYNKLLHMNETPLSHYVMIILYIQNTKMAMANFHFPEFFHNL